MFGCETISPSTHVDVSSTNTNHPNTAADRVHPVMAAALLDGSAPPAGQCACNTAKTAQERPEERGKELEVSTWPPDSPDLNPTELPLDAV